MEASFGRVDQKSVSSLIQHLSMLDFPSQKKLLEPILRHYTNLTCADCDTRSPTWASLDFGVFLCSNCSGAHRALGPTITRVKSANLDLWQEDWLACMVLGNEQLNAYWEADPAAKSKKPNMGSTPEEIRRYVLEKYVKKRYVSDPAEEDPLTVYKKKAGNKVETGEREEGATMPETQQDRTDNSKQNLKNGSGTEQKQNILLLEFDVELPPPASIQNNPQQQLSEAEFTSHSEYGTSFTSQTSKDNFVDFNTLLESQRQGQGMGVGHGALHHSFSTQAVLQHNSLNNQQFLPHDPQNSGFSQQTGQNYTPITHQNYFQHPHGAIGHHSPQSHSTAATTVPSQPAVPSWNI